MQPDVLFRNMTAADIAALIPVAQRIWRAHYPSIISLAQIEYMLETRYTPVNLERQLRDGQQFLLAENGGAIVGFASAGPLAKVENEVLRGSDPVGPADYFLYKCYLAPELQGFGIGSALLYEMEQRLRPARLRLQVARKNVNSWSFYRKRGFSIVDELDFDIGQGYQMLDYVMEKRF